MKKIFYLSLLTIIFVACHGKSEEYGMMREAQTEVASAEYDETDANVGSDDISIEQKIIKSGNITVQTTDADKTKSLIYKYAKRFDGWIVSENSSTYDGQTHYSLSVRIPAQYFDQMLDSIAKSGKHIDEKYISANDVTEEYIDIEARLKTKKELEARYLDLLKKATKVEEILSIEKEIGVLRADIESIEGRLRYLNNSVKYSTLQINYYEPTKNFGNKFLDALKVGWDIILWILLAIVKLWAAIIIAIVAAIIIVKIRRRIRAKKSN